jgi:DNA-binding CsgD family transcriptional regulator
VQGLGQGLSLREFAAGSELTYETVRSYVKRVLAKTGARGQADLVRLTGALR